MKNALCIGINDYPGKHNDLKGCVNDAEDWRNFLNKQGYKVSMLINESATAQSIIKEIERLIQESEKLIITFSGHGSSIKDYSSDEEDGRDECWCSYDGYIIDDDLHILLDNIFEEQQVTIFSDSCHSGTMTRSFSQDKPRYMEPDDVSDSPVIVRKLFEPIEDMREILVSGCKDSEYSYDASFNGVPNGAFTHYTLQILTYNTEITVGGYYELLRRCLPSRQYPQTPQLETAKNNYLLKVI